MRKGMDMNVLLIYWVPDRQVYRYKINQGAPRPCTEVLRVELDWDGYTPWREDLLAKAKVEVEKRGLTVEGLGGKPMGIWKEFYRFVEETLLQDEKLRDLSERSASDDAIFETLLSRLNTELRHWWRNIEDKAHEAVGKYYEDTTAMVDYEARQTVAVPGREQLFSLALDALGPIAGQPVLEVCSGSGAGALRLVERGAVAVASDAFPILTVHADWLEARGIKFQRDLTHGDLRVPHWSQLETYRPLLGPDFTGFAGILGFMGLPLIADRAAAYRGMHQLLAPGGKIALVHDPEVPGRCLPTSAQTVRGILANLRAQGRTKSMLEVTATLIMRRGILHDECRKTLGEEVALTTDAFGNCTIKRYPTYPEWVVFSASKS